MCDCGVRAKPGNLGLRLKDIEIGSYGIVPEHGGAHRSMAPRGAVIPDDVPSLGFTINEKAECWADNVSELYEEAVVRQWRFGRGIPGGVRTPLDGGPQTALCPPCNFFTQ